MRYVESHNVAFAVHDGVFKLPIHVIHYESYMRRTRPRPRVTFSSFLELAVVEPPREFETGESYLHMQNDDDTAQRVARYVRAAARSKVWAVREH